MVTRIENHPSPNINIQFLIQFGCRSCRHWKPGRVRVRKCIEIKQQSAVFLWYFMVFVYVWVVWYRAKRWWQTIYAVYTLTNTHTNTRITIDFFFNTHSLAHSYIVLSLSLSRFFQWKTTNDPKQPKCKHINEVKKKSFQIFGKIRRCCIAHTHTHTQPSAYE